MQAFIWERTDPIVLTILSLSPLRPLSRLSDDGHLMIYLKTVARPKKTL